MQGSKYRTEIHWGMSHDNTPPWRDYIKTPRNLGHSQTKLYRKHDNLNVTPSSHPVPYTCRYKVLRYVYLDTGD